MNRQANAPASQMAIFLLFRRSSLLLFSDQEQNSPVKFDDCWRYRATVANFSLSLIFLK
jgi:hypothetical protein